MNNFITDYDSQEAPFSTLRSYEEAVLSARYSDATQKDFRAQVNAQLALSPHIMASAGIKRLREKWLALDATPAQRGLAPSDKQEGASRLPLIVVVEEEGGQE